MDRLSLDIIFLMDGSVCCSGLRQVRRLPGTVHLTVLQELGIIEHCCVIKEKCGAFDDAC